MKGTAADDPGPPGGPTVRGMRPAAITWPTWIRRAPGPAGGPGSPLRDERTAAILGIALGLAFTACFATGLYSHWAQSGDPWIAFPSRPAGLYRITQAVHVTTGVASIPLLLAKLWTVLPRFFEVPPVRSATHAVERLALLPLVGGSLFLLTTGVANVAAWYPWEFDFVAAHHHASWIAIGGLVAHVGAKLTATRHALAAPDGDDPASDGPAPASDGPAPASDGPVRAGLTRRGFLGVVGGTGALLGGSVGSQSIAPLAPIGFLSPRDLDLGVQGLPVNSSARRRRVVEAATSPDYRLTVTGAVPQDLVLTLDELRALDQHEATLPIACVEGWSKSAHWRGVRLRDLLAIAGAGEGAECTVRSLQQRGAFRTSTVNRNHAGDRDTLLALELNGEVLHLDHGYPVRLIAPNRPGVDQTKWVTEVRVS